MQFLVCRKLQKYSQHHITQRETVRRAINDDDHTPRDGDLCDAGVNHSRSLDGPQMSCVPDTELYVPEVFEVARVLSAGG